MNWRLYTAAVAALCAELPTSCGWASDLDDAVEAAVAAQRCEPDRVVRKGMYEPGDQVMVERRAGLAVTLWLHGEIASIGFAGTRAKNPEDEVYRIKYDGIDTGIKFEKKVPHSRLQVAPQRCDRTFIGNPKYRFLVGANVEMVRSLLQEAPPVHSLSIATVAYTLGLRTDAAVH
jgi:hypothetical protein